MRNFFIFSLFLCVFVSSAQKISLSELQTFCSNKNWETTNKNLLAQKWDYYKSTKGDDDHYDIITWAYGRNYFDDAKASGWIYLHNYDGLPNKILYRFRKKEFYTAIQTQLKNFIYKLTDESIFDDRVTTTYENKDFVLKIAYNREEDEKDSDDDYRYSNSGNFKKTFTVYEVSIFKKGGVYDPNNGLKKDYDEDGLLTYEYFLKNSKLEGKAKSYNSDGKITGEYNFKNGEKEGENISYEFIDDSETYIKTVSNFKNGLLHGKTIQYVVEPDEKYIITLYNYRADKAVGIAYKSRENVIEVKKFENGVLNGTYKEHLDIKSMLLGGMPRIDTLSLPTPIVLEQNYYNDKLNGKAKVFDVSGSLIEEGTYKDSLRTGTWKFYHENYEDGEGNKMEYAGKLYLISNYLNGKVNGTSETFSFLVDVKIPCKEGEENEDDCFKKEVTYLHAISNFKNDDLDGDFEVRKSDEELISKGKYKSGKRSDKWILYNAMKYNEIPFENRTYETGMYLNDKKEGKWERFDDELNLIESFYYKNDQIDGRHITYLSKLPIINKYFDNGTLKKVELLKDLIIIQTVEIVSNNMNNVVVVRTVIDDNNNKETKTITIDKNKSGYEVSPQYFILTLNDLDSSHKVLNGFFESKDATDRTISTGKFSANSKHGEWKDYYYNQNIMTTFIYSNGNLESEAYFDLKKNELFSGEFVYNDIENSTIEERKIKNGKRHGTTRFKDKNDKTIKKESYKEGVLKD